MTNEARQRALGQYLTPEPLAAYMASLFNSSWQRLDLLDAGAGTGTLTKALITRLSEAKSKPERIFVTAYELDPALISPLRQTMHQCERLSAKAGIQFASNIIEQDFIAATTPFVRRDLFARQPHPNYNAAIVNPPYRKIPSNSTSRLLLRSAGIETTNLYAGFIALITRLLGPHGQLVAITPRSFCNGPYFKPFRLDFLRHMSLRQIHLFESRSALFNQDQVLQENVIMHAVKSEPQSSRITISSSSGVSVESAAKHSAPFEEVVAPEDSDRIIHLVVNDRQTTARARMRQLPSTLAGLGISISTGRVVDFRAKDFLRQSAEPGAVPLIYPCHFDAGFVRWPKDNSRKPNAIVCNGQTLALLVPSGIYVLVKRFTAKEERRRIVACVFDPSRIPAPCVGFENHLNYFHMEGHGLPPHLAKGLAVFLNTTTVDDYFRQFNGHTQVNATDLRSLSYPAKHELEAIGKSLNRPGMSQVEIDALAQENIFQWQN